MAPEGSGGRVILKPPPSRCNAAKRWAFTAYQLTAPELKSLIEDEGEYIFGEEICPKTERFHLQGYIEFHTKCRPLEKIKIGSIHWEKAKGDKKSNIKYCSKSGNYHTNMKIPKPIKDPLEGLELYKWQKDIIEIVKGEPDDRKIYWCWEKEGCKGKTSLAKHLCLKYNALYVAGNNADMKFAISACLELEKEIDIVILDIPRTKEGFVSYTGMEEIKNGIFFSSKYESGMKIFNIPHFICLANFEPDITKLSKDRWHIINI